MPCVVADLRTSVDLSLSGFGEDEILELLRGLDAREKRERAEDFDLDSALEEATSEPRVKPGDLWHLGDHRLLCGDATNPEDIERLLGGSRAAMAFTDPPYNVCLGDHGGRQRGARRRRIANDSMDPISWEIFVRAWAQNLLACVDGAIYVCMSSREQPLVWRVLAEEGAHWSDTIIWHKDRFVPGRADYQRSYEPIWYGWREGSSHYWCGDRDQDDVWAIDRPADAPLHPTMKPLALMERGVNFQPALTSRSIVFPQLPWALLAGWSRMALGADQSRRTPPQAAQDGEPRQKVQGALRALGPT